MRITMPITSLTITTRIHITLLPHHRLPNHPAGTVGTVLVVPVVAILLLLLSSRNVMAQERLGCIEQIADQYESYQFE
jgi:hypothetical protein